MFTGIVEEIGAVVAVNRTRAGACLKVKTQHIGADARLGDSIAINGVCLSIIDIKQDILAFDVIQETLRRTTLGELKIGDALNLERGLKPESRMGGHFVTGHIDYRGKIDRIIKDSDGTGFRVSLPAEFSNLVAEKGSVALDGVSLTVAGVERKTFTVYLIPHTLKVTTLGKKQNGEVLNVETDLLAKYLSRYTQKASLHDLLKRYNYI